MRDGDNKFARSPHISALWTGFYRAVQHNLLRVGPYQETLGCLHIESGQDVCGVAGKEQRSVVVPDVSHFPGYMPCDSRSGSEIVIPVFDAQGLRIAVFDVDSTKTAAFDQRMPQVSSAS